MLLLIIFDYLEDVQQKTLSSFTANNLLHIISRGIVGGRLVDRDVIEYTVINKHNYTNMDNSLVNEPFETEPTELGNLIMRLAQDEENNELWREFYDTFANTKFWVPIEQVTTSNPGEEIHLVLDAHSDEIQNLIIFEDKQRLQKNHETYPKERRINIDMAQMTGIGIVQSISSDILPKSSLLIDFGKKTKFVLDRDIVKFMRENLKVVG